MARVQLTRSEIDALSKKLDSMGESMSARERAILLAVFGMASASMKDIAAKGQFEQQTHPKPLQGKAEVAINGALAKLPPLSVAFKDAFVAGEVSQFQVNGLSPVEDSIGVSVGGPCVSVGWSKDLSVVDIGQEVEAI